MFVHSCPQSRIAYSIVRVTRNFSENILGLQLASLAWMWSQFRAEYRTYLKYFANGGPLGLGSRLMNLTPLSFNNFTALL